LIAPRENVAEFQSQRARLSGFVDRKGQALPLAGGKSSRTTLASVSMSIRSMPELIGIPG